MLYLTFQACARSPQAEHLESSSSDGVLRKLVGVLCPLPLPPAPCRAPKNMLRCLHCGGRLLCMLTPAVLHKAVLRP